MSHFSGHSSQYSHTLLSQYIKCIVRTNHRECVDLFGEPGIKAWSAVYCFKPIEKTKTFFLKNDNHYKCCNQKHPLSFVMDICLAMDLSSLIKLRFL